MSGLLTTAFHVQAQCWEHSTPTKNTFRVSEWVNGKGHKHFSMLGMVLNGFLTGIILTCSWQGDR